MTHLHSKHDYTFIFNSSYNLILQFHKNQPCKKAILFPHHSHES